MTSDTRLRVAVLDDYQGVAPHYADWGRLKNVELVSFRDHVHDPRELVAYRLNTATP